MLATLVFATLCLLPGVPLAAALRGRRLEGQTPDLQIARLRYGELVVEGLVLGLAWWSLLGLVVAQVGDLGLFTLGLPTVVVTALAGVTGRRSLGALARPRVTVAGAVVVILVVLAAWMRRDPFYLIYQTSDFSEYIRAGNTLADGGGFSGWFVRLFQVPLAMSSLLFGQRGAVAVLPFLGLLVPVVVASLAARLGLARWVGPIVLALASIDPVATWFSRFPASETLYAVFVSALLLFVLEAVRRRSAPAAVVAGGFAGLLMLTRGNAVLLLPVVVLALPVSALLVDRARLRVTAVFVAAAVASLYAGFVYNSIYSRAYFIDFQLAQFVPPRVLPYLDSFDTIGDAVLGELVLAGAGAVLVAASFRLQVLLGPVAPGRGRLLERRALVERGALVVRRAAVPAGVALSAVLLWGVQGSFGDDGIRRIGGEPASLPVVLADGLSRFDAALVVLALAGFVVVLVSMATRVPLDVRPVLVLGVFVASTFALLHAVRMGFLRPAPYHLYWDRYLFSEVFPVLALLAGVGVDLALRGLRRLHGRGRTPVAVAAAAVFVLGGAAQVIEAERLTREQTFFAGAYGQLAELDELTATAGELPIVYSGFGVDELPSGFFHPNSYRLFATPLAETFDRTLLNSLPDAFAPDPVPDDAAVASLLAGAGVDRAYLVSVVRPPGTRPVRDGAEHLERAEVGRLVAEIPILPRRVEPSDERWRVFEVTLDVEVVEPAAGA